MPLNEDVGKSSASAGSFCCRKTSKVRKVAPRTKPFAVLPSSHSPISWIFLGANLHHTLSALDTVSATRANPGSDPLPACRPQQNDSFQPILERTVVKDAQLTTVFSRKVPGCVFEHAPVGRDHTLRSRDALDWYTSYQPHQIAHAYAQSMDR